MLHTDPLGLLRYPPGLGLAIRTTVHLPMGFLRLDDHSALILNPSNDGPTPCSTSAAAREGWLLRDAATKAAQIKKTAEHVNAEKLEEWNCGRSMRRRAGGILGRSLKQGLKAIVKCAMGL